MLKCLCEEQRNTPGARVINLMVGSIFLKSQISHKRNNTCYSGGNFDLAEIWALTIGRILWLGVAGIYWGGLASLIDLQARAFSRNP